MDTGPECKLSYSGERTDTRGISMGGNAEIFIAGASDRSIGVKRVLRDIDMSVFSGAETALKANYNSADPPPASTHTDTLDALCTAVLAEKPGKLTLAERSGMGNTRGVLEERGVIALAQKRGFSAVVLDELDRTGWREIQAPGLHWSRGFFIAGIFARADRVVQTCCLKTHRFGGHFTMSLKNSVGLVAKRVPGVNYDFMGELHSSPHQRLMIAEINKFYRTDLVVMDATEGFATGGPDIGKLIHPEVIIAGTDRVAIDAVGVALLRSYGTMRDVTDGRIFEQEQIARAAELGVGVASAADIRLFPLDKAAESVADRIQVQLD
ncbi:MAG: DUF362 domain-containing protein [Methanoregula sp.]|nr:DUF362 domain-containing protein [Methanoregula sp.]